MKYTLTVSFETDREMTVQEIEAMTYQVRAQVEEPTTWDLEELDFIDSDLRTAAIAIELEPGKE